jgi:hypothetical protein
MDLRPLAPGAPTNSALPTLLSAGGHGLSFRGGVRCGCLARRLLGLGFQKDRQETQQSENQDRAAQAKPIAVGLIVKSIGSLVVLLPRPRRIHVKHAEEVQNVITGGECTRCHRPGDVPAGNRRDIGRRQGPDLQGRLT